MSLKTELLPCPFCGGKAHIERESDVDGGGQYFTVDCSKSVTNNAFTAAYSELEAA